MNEEAIKILAMKEAGIDPRLAYDNPSNPAAEDADIEKAIKESLKASGGGGEEPETPK